MAHIIKHIATDEPDALTTVEWYAITGPSNLLDEDWCGQEYGVINGGERILDCDGVPLDDGRSGEERAVRQALGIDKAIR